MKVIQQLAKKRFHLYGLGLMVMAAVLVGSGVEGQVASAQAANSVYINPASGPATIGSTLTVSVRENTNTQVNAVQADIGYSTSLLEFVSIDGAGSAFGIDASSVGGNGSVSIARGNTSPVSGDKLVAKVNFKVLAAGTANLQMRDSSIVLSSSNNSNVVTTRNGASFSVAGSTGSTPTPTPAPTPGKTTPAPSPSNRPAPTSAATVSVAPKGSPTGANLAGDSVVELSTPATLQTSPAAGKEVTKVEYYVNGKLEATVTTPPYSYSIKTESYRNGTYTITTKTHYKDGKVESSNASLVVKNQFGATQLFLQLRHYAWLVIILLLVAAELTWLKVSKRRKSKNPYGIYGANQMPAAAGAGMGTGTHDFGAGLPHQPGHSASPAQTDAVQPAETTFAPAVPITPTRPAMPSAGPVAPTPAQAPPSPANPSDQSGQPTDQRPPQA